MKQKPDIYIASGAAAGIEGAEFASANGTYLGFYHVTNTQAAQQLRGWLEAAPLHQQMVSQTKDGDRLLLVAQGKQAPSQVMEQLAAHGVQLTPPEKNEKIDPWKIRAATSVVGQGLQIWSGFATRTRVAYEAAEAAKAGRAFDASGAKADIISILGFATLNMCANLMNWIFGAQEKKDPRQLRFLKSQFNEQIAPLVDGNALPNVDNACLKTRPADPQKKTAGQRVYNFLQGYSVTFGEIGLRVVGSALLAFPKPIQGMKTLFQTQSLKEAFKVAKNPTKTFYVGLTMLAGKFTSLLAKEPDPFNPEPPGLIRRFRESVAFPLSSVIEGGAATYMGASKAINKDGTSNIRVFNRNYDRDLLNAAGNASFVYGYGVRFKAPYGTLEVDMPELYAHISDGLAKLPVEKIPAVLAETSMGLAAHFQKKELPASIIYAAIAADLAKQHKIELVNATAASNTIQTPQAPTKVHAVEHQDRIAQAEQKLAAAI